MRAWGETYKLPVLTTNCSNNYGPWQFPEKMIPVMITAAIDGANMPVYGNGQNVRDWLHVEDHARALRMVLEHGATGETYTIGGAAERTNIDVVRRICTLMDARHPAHAPHERLIRFVTDRPGHDRRYAIDAAKIRRALGWRPEHSFEEGLAATVDWYLANESWWRAIRAGRHSGARLGLATA